MKYIPGIIHKSFQKPHYYEVLNDFIISICSIRNYELQTLGDYEKYTNDIILKKGDIVCFKYFKYSQTSTAYSYLVGYVNEYYHEVNSETILSREFVTLNSTEMDGKLFINITKQVERDNKINLVLDGM